LIKDFSLPFIDDKKLHIVYDSGNLCLYFPNEIDLSNDVDKKGDCITQQAVERIFYGDVYNSHSLTFFLYNLVALRIIENFVLKQNKNIKMLELGCNDGYISRILQRNKFEINEYWGMDFDPVILKRTIENFKETDNLFKSNFFIGDINQRLNIRSCYFDFIFSQEVFDHCYDKFYYSHQFLDEIKRVLKPGGFVYITLVFEHEKRNLYHWDHNYIWKKFEFENVVEDYFDIERKIPLLAFEKIIEEDDNLKKVYDIFPDKLSKMICSNFVDESDIEVMGYLLMKR